MTNFKEAFLKAMRTEKPTRPLAGQSQVTSRKKARKRSEEEHRKKRCADARRAAQKVFSEDEQP
jgi:hypothetical protein